MGAEAVGRPVLELVDVARTRETVCTEVSDVTVTVVVVGTVPVLEHAALMGEIVGSVSSRDSVGGPSLSTPALDPWSSRWSATRPPGSGVSCSGLEACSHNYVPI